MATVFPILSHELHPLQQAFRYTVLLRRVNRLIPMQVHLSFSEATAVVQVVCRLGHRSCRTLVHHFYIGESH